MTKKSLESFVVEGQITKISTSGSCLYVVLETRDGLIYPIVDRFDSYEMAEQVHDFLNRYRRDIRTGLYFSKEVVQQSNNQYRGVGLYRFLQKGREV